MCQCQKKCTEEMLCRNCEMIPSSLAHISWFDLHFNIITLGIILGGKQALIFEYEDTRQVEVISVTSTRDSGALIYFP